MERVTIAYNEATGKIVAMSLGEETDFKQTLLNDQPYLNQLGINNPETLTTMIDKHFHHQNTISAMVNCPDSIELFCPPTR
jgi:hypothetical protein